MHVRPDGFFLFLKTPYVLDMGLIFKLNYRPAKPIFSREIIHILLVDMMPCSAESLSSGKAAWAGRLTFAPSFFSPASLSPHPKPELCCTAKCLKMLIVWVLCWFLELPRSTAHLYLLSVLGFFYSFTDPPWDVPVCGTSLTNWVHVGDFPVLAHHSVKLFIGFSTMQNWRFLKCMKRASPFSQDSIVFLETEGWPH